MTNDPNALLREKELSKLLNISQRTLQQWRLRGTGPQSLLLAGRIIRYRLSDVEEWLNGGGKDPVSK